MNLLWFLPLGVLCLWAGVFAIFARPLAMRWCEPVLCHPVLVIESDDWGAGPLEQAESLKRLADLLQGVRDVSGRPALMTLGVVLEVPDGARIVAEDGARYYGLPLSAPCFEPIRTAVIAGMEAGVFEPQLHGQCHYWPESVMVAARTDAKLRAWLTCAEPARTEELPAHLQSRWVDASVLPSRPHSMEAIRQAVAVEAMGYRALFGVSPAVVVATTFVWDDAVESAWHLAGVKTVITPGQRATCRQLDGRPGCAGRTLLTGGKADSGLTYLVRDVYFEPALGHEPERVAECLQMRVSQGRACLIETHRFNFLDQPEVSLRGLDAALRTAIKRVPTLRFLAPADLADAIRQRDPAWIEMRLTHRLAAWRMRLSEIPRFSRVARLTGLKWLLA